MGEGAIMVTRKRNSSTKSKTNRTSRTRVSTKPVDLEAVRQKITNLVARGAGEMVAGVMDEVSNRGNVTGLKYLFEAVGMFPRPEGGESDDGEETLADKLLKHLELSLAPEEEDEDSEAAESAESMT